APPTRSDYQYKSTPSAGQHEILVPMAAPGVWYILVYAEAVPAPSTFALSATASAVSLSSVTPTRHGNGADMTLTTAGAGFDATATVQLVAGGGATYDAATVAADLPTQLTATFRAGAVPPGVYTVRVTKPGNVTAQLPDAFTVVAGGRPELRTNLVLPQAV